MEKIDLSISRLNILRLPCRRFKIAVFQSSIFTIFFQFCNQLCDVFKTPCPEIEVCFSNVTSVPPSCFSFSEISRKLLFTNVNCWKLYTILHWNWRSAHYRILHIKCKRTKWHLLHTSSKNHWRTLQLEAARVKMIKTSCSKILRNSRRFPFWSPL